MSARGGVPILTVLFFAIPVLAVFASLVMASCGSSVVQQSTPVEVVPDAIPDSGVDAGLADAGGDGGTPEDASVVELPGEYTLEGRSPRGPFKSVKAFCTTLKKEGKGRCLKKKDSWNRRVKLGGRGQLIAAATRTIRLDDSGEFPVDACATLIRDSEGWWALDSDVVCRQGEHGDFTSTTTSLAYFGYADRLSHGVLELQRFRVDPGTEHDVLAGEKVIHQFRIEMSQLMFCARLEEGVVCTDWLTTSCAGFHMDGARDVMHADGTLHVTSSGWDYDGCNGRLLKPGTHHLFGEETLAPSVAISRDDQDESDPLSTDYLIGPVSSIADYCKSVGASWIVEDGYEDNGGPLPRDRCLVGRKDWTRVQPKGGRGEFRGARLLRVGSTLVGERIEYCHVAMRTEAGWFVSRERYQCFGIMGPNVDVRRKIVKTRWLGRGGDGVLALVFDDFMDTEEVGGCHGGGPFNYDYDPGIGMEFDPEEPPWEGVEAESDVPPDPQLENFEMGPSGPFFGSGKCKGPYVFTTTSRWLKLCGVGPSGVPSCTGNFLLGCPYPAENRKKMEDWTFVDGVLTLPDDEDLYSGCDAYSELEPGSYEIKFP